MSFKVSFEHLQEIRERNYVKFPWRDIPPDQIKSKIKRLIEEYTGTRLDVKFRVLGAGDFKLFNITKIVQRGDSL